MSHLKQVVGAFRSTIPSNFRSLANISFTAGFFLLGLSVSGAQAAIVVYSGNASQAAWEAASSSPSTLVDFNLTSPLPPGFALTTGSDQLGAFVFDFPGGVFDGAFRDRANDDQTTAPAITSLGNGVTAIGADWNLAVDEAGTGVRLFITFVDSTTELIMQEIPNTFAGQFFGIVSDVAIRSISFVEGTQSGPEGDFETYQLDNARFVSAVPLPAALPLFLSAIAALGFIGRRKKRLAVA